MVVPDKRGSIVAVVFYETALQRVHRLILCEADSRFEGHVVVLCAAGPFGHACVTLESCQSTVEIAGQAVCSRPRGLRVRVVHP